MDMTRTDLIIRVRSYTRDFSNSIFREQDIILYINEGINRIKQVIPELRKMPLLNNASDKVKILPPEYHHLIAVYATARCFAQDERHYQATIHMNEFELKIDELKQNIEAGEVIITDPDTGEPIEAIYVEDYVRDNYFTTRRKSNLFDYPGGED